MLSRSIYLVSEEKDEVPSKAAGRVEALGDRDLNPDKQIQSLLSYR